MAQGHISLSVTSRYRTGVFIGQSWVGGPKYDPTPEHQLYLGDIICNIVITTSFVHWTTNTRLHTRTLE
jgi:hypothetical protein